MDADGNGLLDVNEFLAPRVVKELYFEMPGQPDTVIRPYEPHAFWLWRRWRGTVLGKTWKPVLFNIGVGLALAAWLNMVRPHLPCTSWLCWAAPDSADPRIARLLLLAGVWDRQFTLASFVITFFVGQALSFWRLCYAHARSVSSALSDLNLMLVAHAARDSNGACTPAAQALLETTARRSRLFYVLYWSNTVRRYSPVNSDPGLRILMQRGDCTPAEFALLKKLPRENRLHAVAAWIVAAGQQSCAHAMDGGGARALEGLDEGAWIERSCHLRVAYGRIKRDLAARIPLQYMHLVQILVDTLVLETPFAMFARFGVMGIPLGGVITMSYLGLVLVSKSFLDPFGNMGTDVEIQVHVLLHDANAASKRWLEAGLALPARDYDEAGELLQRSNAVLEEAEYGV